MRHRIIIIGLAIFLSIFLLLLEIYIKSGFISFLFPVPGILIISGAYLVWGHRPRKKSKVILSIVAIILVILYSIVIITLIFIVKMFGDFYTEMSKPIEKTGREAVKVFPAKILPHIQDVDSSYYANIGWEEPITFIAYNISSTFRDSVILAWFNLTELPPSKGSLYLEVSEFECSHLPLLSHFWNPNALNKAIFFEHTEDPYRYRKYAIYDSLGVRLLLYSWYE